MEQERRNAFGWRFGSSGSSLPLRRRSAGTTRRDRRYRPLASPDVAEVPQLLFDLPLSCLVLLARDRPTRSLFPTGRGHRASPRSSRPLEALVGRNTRDGMGRDEIRQQGSLDHLPRHVLRHRQAEQV